MLIRSPPDRIEGLRSGHPLTGDLPFSCMVRPMSLSRLVSVMSVVVFGTAGVVSAQPKKKTPASKTPVAPAKDPAPTTPATPDATATTPPAADEPPPKDMNGVDENPDAPKTEGQPDPTIPVVPVKKPTAGYPVEEALRPITLPQNMSEISIGPHFVVSPYAGGDALRARYGITREVQLGLTYLFGGIYDDPAQMGKQYGFHPGKAIGLDVTVLLQNWIGVKIGVPVYIQPVAVSLAIGVPIKFAFGDKWALGGFDDLLNIKLKRFAPTFYQEVDNATAANGDKNNTVQSNGVLRVSFYGIYQYQPTIAIVGRIGLNSSLGTSNNQAGASASESGSQTFIRAGMDFTPRHFIDVGFSLGFDDLTQKGSFGPAGYLALRI